MYYPYFRGKQYDLLAIKSLIEADRLSDQIRPIIEPVKDSRTLHTFLASAHNQQQPLFVIKNPQAGQFLTETGLTDLEHSIDHSAYIIDRSLDSLAVDPEIWIVQESRPVLESDWQMNTRPVLVPLEFRLLEKISGPKILSEDPYTRLPKTAFYQEIPDELFSTTQVTYQKRGFIGFSDFSIDSRIYYEKGYPTPILSLHLVYFVDNTLRIHHFLSPDDDRSQKEKFFRLMDQVLPWLDRLTGKVPTLGLSQLLDAFDKKHFPGLGTMRKASVMHHLEVMSRFLASQEK